MPVTSSASVIDEAMVRYVAVLPISQPTVTTPHGPSSVMRCEPVAVVGPRRRGVRYTESPPKGSGGYSHWHCQLKRHHDGLHRFNNMTWGEIDGMELGVVHHPVDARPPEKSDG